MIAWFARSGGSVFGFFVVWSFVGTTFLDIFAVPSYDLEIWHFGVAVGLGVIAAFLSRLLGQPRS